MFTAKCPGQDMRFWTAEDIHEEKCPNCNELIEFWKTDIRVRCRKCKTRVVNPRFNLGCAQWCSYAEQCLGSGVKGLSSISLRSALEQKLVQKAGISGETIKDINKVLNKAEQSCLENKIELLPVITALVISILKYYKHLDSSNEKNYLEDLSREHALPPDALHDTLNILDNLSNGILEEKAENIVSELLEEFNSLTAPKFRG